VAAAAVAAAAWANGAVRGERPVGFYCSPSLMRGFPGENGGGGSAAVAVAVRRQNAAAMVVVGRMRRRKLPPPVCAVPTAASPFSAKESSIPFRSYSQTGWSFLNKFGSEGLKPSLFTISSYSCL
jgi:hypothetical protein